MENLRLELIKWLRKQIITSDNIGAIRRQCFVPWDSQWNTIVKVETADREGKSVAIGEVVEFIHAGVTWRGRVFNVNEKNLQITVDGYSEIFHVPKDYRFKRHAAWIEG